MRSIFTVVEAIKKQIPKDWHDRRDMIQDLDRHLESARYRAPELNHLNFEQVAHCLQKFLGQPNTDWKITIADIFSDKIKA